MKKLEQKILSFVKRENLISRGDKILIALSGGPDSVFALRFLLKYKNKFKIDISCFHLNHMLRGKESDEDEKFCRALCKELDLKFYSGKADIKNIAGRFKMSLEEAARTIRYKKLESLAKLGRFDKIVTAHNAGDNGETMLLNLFTGCGLHGISGIPAVRGKIIRPLLPATKPEIMDYLKICKIPYRIDSTNFLDDYKRNYLRNKIIPQLKKEFNPRLEDALFRSSRIFQESKNLIDRYSDRLMDENAVFRNGKLLIKPGGISDSEEMPGNLLRNAIAKYFSLEFTYDDYISIKDLFKKQVGKRISLSSNLTAQKERNGIEIFVPRKVENSYYEIKIGEKIKVGDKIIGINETNTGLRTSKNVEKSEIIEADNIDDIFILRKWKNGDKFIPLGMKGFKKISDFLTDQKVPSSEKNERFLLLNRNNVVWICGLRIDERYKTTENTKRKLQLWIKKTAK